MPPTLSPRQCRTVAVVCLLVASVWASVVPAAAAGTTGVSLSPADSNVGVGSSTTYAVVVDSATNGVRSYDLSVSIDNISVGTIESVSFRGSPRLTDATYAADNSSVNIVGTIANTPDAGAVTVAMVTVTGVTRGSTELSVTVNALGDEADRAYTVTGTTGATLSVQESTSTPVARITQTRTTVNVGDTVAFDGSGSSTPDGAVDSYEWLFDDGTSATGVQAAHTYDTPGTYQVQLTITDNSGKVDTATRVVEVDGRSPDDSTGVEITDTTVDPDDQLPAVEGLKKTVSAEVTGTVDRVQFYVGDDEYVDSDGTDGWAVEVPLSGYTADTTVKMVAVGPDSRDSVTRGLGVGQIDSVPDYIIENANTNLQPDRVSFVAVMPPPIFPDEIGGTIAVGRFEIELEGSVRADVLFDPLATQLGGGLSGEAAVTPVKATGEGTIVGRDNLSEPGSLNSIRARLSVAGGASKAVGLEVFGFGVSVEVFFGPYIEADPLVWDDPREFPSNPARSTVGSGFRASASADKDLGVGALKGSVGGEGGLEFQFPDPADDVAITGAVTGNLVKEGPFTRNTIEVTIWEDSVQVTSVPGEIEATLRRHNGTVPLATDGVSTAAPGEQVVADRLTADGLPDESPTVTTTDDGYLLTWNRQSADRSVLEGHDVYVRHGDGGANWSAPVRVTNDTRADFDPDIAVDGTGDAVLAWTRLNQTITNASNASFDRSFRLSEVALATGEANVSGERNWSTPELVTDEVGSAFQPRVAPAPAAGEYHLAWRYDADADQATTDDRGVRYAVYDTATESLGPVTTIQNARSPRLTATGGSATDTPTGVRLAYFTPNTPGEQNGTVVVRNLATGTSTSAPVTRFTDHAITGKTAVWVNGSGSNETIQYRRPDGEVGAVGTGDVTGVRDVGLVSRRTAGGERADVLTFRGRPPSTNETAGDVDVFYRVRRGGNWTTPRSLTPGRSDLTFSQATTAGRSGGLVSVFEGENLSAPAEQSDLFFVRHVYGADLNVSASATSTPATPGENLTLNYTLSNQGAVTADNVSLTVRDATGPVATVRSPGNATVQPGQRVNGSITVTANRSRIVTVDANSDNEERAESDNSVNVSVMRPNLTVTGVDRHPRANGVGYDVKIRNDGPLNATNTTVRVTNNGRTVNGSTRSIGRLDIGETTGVNVTLSGKNVSPSLVTRVRVNSSAQNSTGAGDAVRIRPPTADLLVVPATIGPAIKNGCTANATVGPATSQTALCVLVGNRGSIGTNASVTVRTNDSANVTRTVQIPGSQPNGTAYRSVAVETAELDLQSGDNVTVSAQATVPDENPIDNVAGYSVGEALMFPFPNGVPNVGTDSPPTDVDRDGLYEDIDGDSETTYADVVALFRAFDSPALVGQTSLFDFNDNNRLDFVDIVELFREVGRL